MCIKICSVYTDYPLQKFVLKLEKLYAGTASVNFLGK